MKNGDYILVVAPEDYPGKKYRNRYCYEHVLVYWQTHGILPNSNEIVHHADGNKQNNSPENLLLMANKSHAKFHGSKQGKRLVELVCPGCQTRFIIDRRKTYLVKTANKVTCCSRHCAGIYSTLSQNEKERRRSQMFVREFHTGEQTSP